MQITRNVAVQVSTITPTSYDQNKKKILTLILFQEAEPSNGCPMDVHTLLGVYIYIYISLGYHLFKRGPIVIHRILCASWVTALGPPGSLKLNRHYMLGVQI